MLTRDTILKELKTQLESVSKIYAMWLEGSDGVCDTDEYSDLDIVFDVEDGFELDAFQLIDQILLSLGVLDLNYQRENYHPKLLDKVYHLKETAESLFLDVTIQSHSRNYKFIKQNDSEMPSVLFDKKNIIQYEDLDEVKLCCELYERLYHLENTIRQKARVVKYVRRKKPIEAMGYYQKYILQPLIELLRIKYKPINYDYYIVRASKHLPKDVVERLGAFSLVSSLDELEQKTIQAYNLFFSLLPEVKAELEANLSER